MRNVARFLAIAPVCVALALFGPQIAAHALLSLGFASAAACFFDDPDWRAAALSSAGRWDAAGEIYARDEARAYNLGTALAHAGRFDDALAAFERALAAHPDDEDAAFNKALLEAALQKPPSSASGGVNGVRANSAASKAGGARERPVSEGQNSGSGDGLAAGRNTESGGEAGGGAAKQGAGEEGAHFSRAIASGAAGASGGEGRSGDQTNVTELLRERERRMGRRLEAGRVHPSLEWLQTLPDDPGRFLKLKILAEKMRRLHDAGGPMLEDD